LFGLLFVAADTGKFASLCSHRDAGPGHWLQGLSAEVEASIDGSVICDHQV
jgi:hypothetical protein